MNAVDSLVTDWSVRGIAAERPPEVQQGRSLNFKRRHIEKDHHDHGRNLGTKDLTVHEIDDIDEISKQQEKTMWGRELFEAGISSRHVI
jgi:hypothetical protein